MRPVIALGDIHGNLRIFKRLAAMRTQYPDAEVVFIGDYIDGHVDGFKVLKRVRELQQDDAHVHVLAGNHEYEMVRYFLNAQEDFWLSIGGRDTLRHAAFLATGESGADLANRGTVIAHESELIKWVADLDVEYSIGKLQFVHAGYDMKQDDPIAQTGQYTKLTARGAYFYYQFQVFAHNPYPFSIVTGHTATWMVGGHYEHDELLTKYTNPNAASSPIYTIVYPGEMPRYLLDGGISGRNDWVGNVAVFDADTGMLIDSLED